MVHIAYSGGLLLDLDLLVEVARHPAEVTDHHFEVVDLLPFLVVLKPLIIRGIVGLNHCFNEPPNSSYAFSGPLLSSLFSFTQNH